MKFTVGSKVLLEKLQFLGGVIPSKSTLKILENFLFEITDNVLKVTASDLETTISANFDIDSDKNGKLALPAKILLESLKVFSEQPLTFEVRKNKSVEITSASGKYVIESESGDDFPVLPVLENTSFVSIPSEILLTAISRTLFATGADDLRPVMTGVLFEFSESGLNFVATDSHKLTKYCRADILPDASANFIVPKKPLAVLKSLLASAENSLQIEHNASNATFYLDDYTVNCRLIDAIYPNYNAVIPKENPNVLLIDRQMLLNALKCVSIYADKQTREVHFKISGSELHVSAEDLGYSHKADECLACDYKGDDLLIGFNSKFLLEMLNNIDSEIIHLEMSEANRAGILKPVGGLDEGESLLMLVMPVLIK